MTDEPTAPAVDNSPPDTPSSAPTTAPTDAPAAHSAAHSVGNGAGAAGVDGPLLVADEPAQVPPPKKKAINRTVIEWTVLVVAAIVIALVIKTFLFQAFYIPSASMEPTLMIGDRVLVNKLSYDLHDVHRGDIVVFESGPNVQWHKAGIDDLVKRVIALPGETITECETGKVCIDGRLLKESYLPKGTVTTISSTPNGCEPDSPPNGCTVPAGHLFVMGDNRTNSQDARVNGPIKESSIVGRVFVRIWPLNRLGFL